MGFEFFNSTIDIYNSAIEWTQEPQNSWFLSVTSLILGIPGFFGIFYYQLKRLFLQRYYLGENYNQESFRRVSGYIPIRCNHREPEIVIPSANNLPDGEFDINEPDSDSTVIGHLLKSSHLGSRWKNKSFKKVLVIGGPGTGKSLSLYKLFKRLSNPLGLIINKYPRVILYSMNRWKKEGDWMHDRDLLPLMTEEKKNSMSNCVIILDAFDEFCEAQKLTDEKAEELIHILFNDFSGFKAVVIATRPIQNFSFGKDVTHLHLLPFNAIEIQKSVKKKYAWKVPYILKWNKGYLELNKRLVENNNFLLKRICRRPLLLRYLEDLTNIPYQISKEKFVEVVDIEDFEPSEVCLRNYPFWGEQQFRKALKRETEIQTNSRIRVRLVSVTKKLIEVAARVGRLESNATIYHHILMRWHGREAKKNNLNTDEFRHLFFLFMDEVLTAVAGFMAAKHTLAITEEDFGSEVTKVHSSWKSNIREDRIRKKFLDTVLPQDQRGALNPTKHSILKFSDNRNLHFTHRSFYDYYLAKFILSQDGNEIAKLRILELQESSEAWMFYKEMVNSQYHSETFGLETNLDLETPRFITSKLEWLNRKNELEMIELVLDKAKFKIEENEPCTSFVILQLSITLWAFRKGNVKLLSCIYKTKRFGYEGLILANFDYTHTKSEIFRLSLIELFFSFASHLSITNLLKELPEKEIRDLLETTYDHGMTPLSWACVSNSTETVKTLLNAYTGDKNQWLETQTINGWTVLMLACANNSFETVNALLTAYRGDKNQWLEKQNNKGFTALMIACHKNSYQAVNSLLNAYSGDKNHWLETQEGQGWTALMLACGHNSFETVKALLTAHTGDQIRWLETQNIEGFTSLMIACINNSFDKVSILLKAHCGNKNHFMEIKNKEGWNALTISCLHSSFEIVNILLSSYSGDKSHWMEIQNNDGWTTLMFACQNNTLDTVKILLKSHSGNKDYWLEMQNKRGFTALIYASAHNSFETVNYLLNSHSGNKNQWMEIQEHDEEGWTALMAACCYNSFETVNTLLTSYSGEKNKWLEMQKKNGRTALILACMHNSFETVEAILNAYSGNKIQLLEMQDRAGHTALVKALLFIPGKRHEYSDQEGKPYHNLYPKGIDPIQFDNQNTFKIVRLLLDHGAKANSPFPGISLKDVALKNGHYLAAELL